MAGPSPFSGSVVIIVGILITAGIIVWIIFPNPVVHDNAGVGLSQYQTSAEIAGTKGETPQTRYSNENTFGYIAGDSYVLSVRAWGVKDDNRLYTEEAFVSFEKETISLVEEGGFVLIQDSIEISQTPNSVWIVATFQMPSTVSE